MSTVTEKREPMWVHCDCGHEFVPAYLPMDAGKLAQLMKKMSCPMCGSGSKKHRLGQKPKPTTEGDPVAWLANGDTGTSSLTIWSVMMGRPMPSDRQPDIPCDPSDFGRCYRLLQVMPSWRARLGEVAEAHPIWRPFVDVWDELTALYEEELPSGVCHKLYARQRAIRGVE